jgi:hypothetical protein
MHGKEFRERAQSSQALRDKYDFLRCIFTAEDGTQVEYPQLSDFTIVEVHGKLQQEARKRSVMEAIEAMKELENMEYDNRADYIASIRESTESIAEQEEMDAEVESPELINSPFFGMLLKRR